MSDFVKAYAHFYKQYVKLRKASAGEWEWILVYPLVHIFSTGFLVMFLSQIGAHASAAAYVLVGAIAWNFYVLCQRGITYGILPEIWSDSTKHQVISPATALHFIIGNGVYGAFTAMLSLLLMYVTALLFFGFNILATGPALVLALIGLLIYGTAEGLLINAVMMLKGPEYMNLAWIITGVVMVLSAVYYPLELLPAQAQLISNVLPTTHAIQAMRQPLVGINDGVASGLTAIAIGLVYLVISTVIFVKAIDKSRENGTVLRL